MFLQKTLKTLRYKHSITFSTLQKEVSNHAAAVKVKAAEVRDQERLNLEETKIDKENVIKLKKAEIDVIYLSSKIKELVCYPRCKTF